MEHEQPPSRENHDDPLWPSKAHQSWPTLPLSARHSAARSRARRRKRVFGHYGKLLLILLAGLACFALILTLGSVYWGFAEFSKEGRVGDIAGDEPVAFYLFFGAILLSSCLMTLLARGGTIFPVLLFALLAYAATLNLMEYASVVFAADLPSGQLSGILKELPKLPLALFCAAAGFILTKLLIKSGRRYL